jgi:hypothetical protein
MYDRTTSIEYLGAKFPHLLEELHDETWEGLLHVQMGVFSRWAQDSIKLAIRKRGSGSPKSSWTYGVTALRT